VPPGQTLDPFYGRAPSGAAVFYADVKPTT
jgi:hypothetical protein